jgi:hypothetical protein
MDGVQIHLSTLVRLRNIPKGCHKLGICMIYLETYEANL